MPRTLPQALLALLTAALVPASAAAQSAYTWRNVEIVGGGFVPGIVFNTGEPGLIYARTDIGGAYRWNPATNRWIPLMDWVSFDEWNLMGVDSLATDPVDPNRVYVLAGTYTNVWTNMNGAVLRSTNRGNTWQRTMLPFKSGGNMPGRSMGERLAIDPNRNATLYLGARSGNGLWRSTDFGATWARVTSFPNPGTFIPLPGDVYQGDIVGVVWVVFDARTGSPGNTTQTIYVGVADKGNSIYRSTNGGASWSAVAGQPTGFLPHHGVLSSTGMLYVTYSDGAGPYDGQKGDVWRLDTDTGVWTLISPVPSSSADDYFGYGGLAVDAQHPNTIMVAALNSWWPDTILFRSLDAGTTWTRIWDWAGYPSRSFRYTQHITGAPWLTFNANPQPPEIAPKLGWMVGDLEIDPFDSDRMLYGTGATIYGSDNLTAWDTGGQIGVSVRAQGLEETAVLDLISPPSGAPLLSGLGDIGGFRHDNLSAVPARMFGSPTMTTTTGLDFAELTPNFIVRVGNADTANGTRRVGFSFDGGTSWFQGQEPGGVSGGGSVAASANASRVVWSPQGANVHFSTNNGSSWTPSAGIPSGARVAADRVNPMKFYGFVNGTFYVSTNGGASFAARAATGLPTSGMAKAVPGREGDVWLAGGTEGGVYGLWHSTDSGASFTKLANVQEADNIGLGMAAPGQSYPALYTSAQIGGVRGIFRSVDAGASWVRINDDQHQYASTNAAITGDPRVFGRVYLSSNGRGVIVGEAGPAGADFSLSANPPSLTVNRGASGTSAIAITRTGGFTGSVAFSASGLPSGVTASFSPASTTGASTTLMLAASSTAAAGTATVTITGSGGGLTRTTTVTLTVNAPDFSLSASPTSFSVAPGACVQVPITIVRSGGFAASVTFSATGLPSGWTASFSPASTSGTSVVGTFCIPSNAPAGTVTITITATGGGLTRTIAIVITVTPINSNFTLAANPASLSMARGASGASTINITRTNFTGAVAFTATGVPSGVTASFSAGSTTGNSVSLNLAVSSAAALATSTIMVNGSGGGLSRSTTVSLTVTGDTGTGGVTVTPAVTTNSAWFNEEVVRLSNTGPLTALAVTIVIQRTTGVSFSGQYNTVGGQIQQSNSSTTAAVTYTFNLAAGQTLGMGADRTFAAQTSGQGTVHPTAGDTFIVTYTTGGVTYTQTGHF